MFLNMNSIVSYTINSSDTCFQLTILFSRFTHVVTCGWNSFSLLCKITLYEWTIVYLFYCQWTFGLFPVYAIMNVAVISIIYMFPSLFLYKIFFYSINLEELLLTKLYKYSGFLENAKMFTQCLFEYIFLKNHIILFFHISTRNTSDWSASIIVV